MLRNGKFYRIYVNDTGFNTKKEALKHISKKITEGITDGKTRFDLDIQISGFSKLFASHEGWLR